MPANTINPDLNDKNVTNPQVNTDDGWKPDEVPQLTVDVYKEGEVIFLISTVAGVQPADLDVSVEGTTVIIKGTRKPPYPSSSKVLLSECFWGEFQRELDLNENLDVDNIKAALKQGILTVEIPIIKLTNSKQIKVDFM
jgi:HSP20 family protein